MKIQLTSAAVHFSLGLIFFLSSPVLADDSNFRVGGLLCLTGDCAEIGTNSQKGVELAAEELNGAGGVLGKKIELKFEDTREEDGPALVLSAYKNLVLDGTIHYLIGPTWTVGGLPLAPILAKRPDIIAVSPSLGVAAYNEAADTIFNTWPHDDGSTETLAKYAIKKGWHKAAVLSDQSPWESTQAQHFMDTFKRLGGEISIFLEPSPEVKDLRTEVTKIRYSGAQMVFMSDYTVMDLAAKEMRRQQMTLPKMGILLDDSRLKSSEGALEGLLYVQYQAPTSDFVERFKSKFHESPGLGADTAYDAMKIIAAGITKAASFKTDDVKKEMLAIQYQGASGEIHFDDKGGVRKSPDIWVVKDGARARIGSATELLK